MSLVWGTETKFPQKIFNSKLPLVQFLSISCHSTNEQGGTCNVSQTSSAHCWSPLFGTHSCHIDRDIYPKSSSHSSSKFEYPTFKIWSNWKQANHIEEMKYFFYQTTQFYCILIRNFYLYRNKWTHLLRRFGHKLSDNIPYNFSYLYDSIRYCAC